MNREETRKAAEIMLAYADGKDIEFSDRWAVDQISSGKTRWSRVDEPLWSWDCCKYRIAVTPDVHQWDLYPDWVIYAARDYFGEMQLYQKEPIRVGEKYWGTGKRGHELKITGLKIYTQGTCDWKDSKQKR